MSPQISLVFALIKIMLLASVIFSVASSLISYNKTFTKSSKKRLVNIVAVSAIAGTLFGLPLFQSVYLSQRGHAVNVNISNGSPRAFYIGFRDVSVTFDPENNLWVYQIAVRNQREDDGEIVGIGIVAQNQLQGNLIFNPEKKQLAPPFGEGIEVVGGEKTSNKIIIKPSYTARLKIFSKDLLLSIALTEKNGSYDIQFWSPEPQKEEDYVESLDPNVKVILVSPVSLVGDVPLIESQRIMFSSGRIVLPMMQGLDNGTKFGFRIIDSNGAVVVPIDIIGKLGEAKGSVFGGTAWESFGRFNSEPDPLLMGNYRMELIKVENGRGFIMAYSNFSVEPEEEDNVALDPNVNVILSTDKLDPTASVKTHFSSGETFFPFVQGLQKGTIYGYRIVNSNEAIIIPLNDFTKARGEGLERFGVPWGFNFQGYSPLRPGYYKMELIIANNDEYTIVSYLDFTISSSS